SSIDPFAIISHHVALVSTDATRGIGNAANPLNVELVQGAVDPSEDPGTITANSAGSVNLTVQGLVQGFPNLLLGPIVAGRSANVEVKEAIDSFGDGRTSFVSVDEITAGGDVNFTANHAAVTLLNHGGPSTTKHS